MTTKSSPHPLVGKYLNWEDDDSAYYGTYRFAAALGDDFMLLERVNVVTREPAGQFQIVALGQLAMAREGAVVYPDKESVESWGEEDREEAKEKVIRLVKKGEDPSECAE